MQNVINALVLVSVLDRRGVSGGFDNADLAVIPRLVRANRAELSVGQITAP